MRRNTIPAAVARFPRDEVVLVRAIKLALTHQAALIVVHIIDVPDPEWGPGLMNTLHEQAAAAARDRIGAALGSLGSNSSGTRIIVEQGPVAERLADICQDIRPDLTVMRAHQRKSIFDRFVGSTVERAISSDVAPVLVLRRYAERYYKQVIIATDGTDSAQGALAYVAALLPDAALHLVRAVDVVPHFEGARAMAENG